MDYKYIEQLLDRYWNCETSLEEEKILHSFFAQKDVPVRLLPYRDLFAGQALHAEEHLDASFDKKILALTEEKRTGDQRVSARRLTRTYTLRPFFHAAASVAVFLCLGMAVQQASLHNEGEMQIVKTNTQQVSPVSMPAAFDAAEVLPTDTTLLKTDDQNL